jgi:hypothetical protein
MLVFLAASVLGFSHVGSALRPSLTHPQLRVSMLYRTAGGERTASRECPLRSELFEALGRIEKRRRTDVHPLVN